MQEEKIIGLVNHILLSYAFRYVDEYITHYNEQFTIDRFKKAVPKTAVEYIEFFNHNNDFSKNKIGLLIYLTCISYSDKNKEALLDYLSNDEFYFYPTDFGIVNRGIEKLLESKDDRLVLTCNYNSKINCDRFNHNKYYLGEEDITTCATKSIEFISNHRVSNFVLRGMDVLSYWAKNSLTYRCYFGSTDIEGLIKILKVESSVLGVGMGW